MNAYGWIIFLALVVEAALKVGANLLNLMRLNPELPCEFVSVYNAGTYRKSQEYLRARTRFDILSTGLNLSATLTFWFVGGFNTLDQWVRSFGLGPVSTGLLYIGILLLLVTGYRLPLSLYQTFGIEARFGFNKTTPRTFVFDFLKVAALAILFGGPLLAGILWFFQYAGPLAWVDGWLICAAFILFLQYLAPAWILPLFNKLEPLPEGVLKERIAAYTRSVGFPLGGIFVMDGSKRSTKANAFFTGFGKNRRIVLYDTLIKGHTEDELLAILAHEIGHFKKRHLLIGLWITIFHMGGLFFLLSLFLTQKGLFDAFYMRHMSVYAGFVFFGMLYTPIELFLTVFLNMLSRRNEREADRFAVTTTHLKEAYITALKKLSVHNLSNLTPHPFYHFLYATHPTALERILAVKGIDPKRQGKESETIPPATPGDGGLKTMGKYTIQKQI